ncbi:hypothetical protein HEK616_08020 [Streptomyces nigrescens]|uniref:Uncharacterized protein n=1 Tax=Streptomyces nigrescens TaxID=1920 RepID=A0ABN6QMZ2_STRNI|nr:hypothetical protein [Streptomyces nigrescens]BDM67315.1 hypothetical protein HEK616_08020 [Streptomyces nigrescens]
MGDLNDVGPDAWVWNPNVDYLSGWRHARESAGRLNDALRDAGLDSSTVWAVPNVDADGRGVVRLAASLPAADELAELLRPRSTHSRRREA